MRPLSVVLGTEGSDPEADYALHKIGEINAFLKQGLGETTSFDETISKLISIVS